jgi:citrate lyase alpha subunit
MTLRLTIDRFEGEGQALAVLLTDEGQAINFPRRLLPESVKAGDVLKFEIRPDRAATKKLKRTSRQVEEELDRRDPGGDITL